MAEPRRIVICDDSKTYATALKQFLEHDAGIEVVHESVSWKHSSNGKYVSVRIAFRAETREQYDAAHAALRAHPEVKWTL